MCHNFFLFPFLCPHPWCEGRKEVTEGGGRNELCMKLKAVNSYETRTYFDHVISFMRAILAAMLLCNPSRELVQQQNKYQCCRNNTQTE